LGDISTKLGAFFHKTSGHTDLKITEKPTFLGNFIPRLSLCTNCVKNGLSYILGDLFTNSSGIDVMIAIFGDFCQFSAKKLKSKHRSLVTLPRSMRLFRFQFNFFASLQGTDVMILKIFSPKNLAEILVGFARTTASLCKSLIITLVFGEKRQLFRRKLAKIVENCDLNIDPRLRCYVCN
jgi:hypothetical protein